MLTEEQKSAVDFDLGGLLLIARAGSGKTHTVKERFCKLIKNGVDPSRILCITFTNKAGAEMRERVSEATHILQNKLSIFTFHGLCNYWLRRLGTEVGLENYTILDPDSGANIVKNICSLTVFSKVEFKKFAAGKTDPIEKLTADYLKIENKQLKPLKYRVVSSVISEIGNKNISIEKAAQNLSVVSHLDFIKSCCEEYIDYKQEHGYIDFNDLELAGIELFKKIDCSKIYDYVMVDEIQDSSSVDIDLLKSLKISNMMAVGDPFQSIYGFRGASSTNTNDFKNAFSADTMYLSKNFRSHKSIIELANATMNCEEKDKMIPHSDKNGIIALTDFKEMSYQMKSIVRTIRNFVLD